MRFKAVLKGHAPKSGRFALFVRIDRRHVAEDFAAASHLAGVRQVDEVQQRVQFDGMNVFILFREVLTHLGDGFVFAEQQLVSPIPQ